MVLLVTVSNGWPEVGIFELSACIVLLKAEDPRLDLLPRPRL